MASRASFWASLEEAPNDNDDDEDAALEDYDAKDNGAERKVFLNGVVNLSRDRNTETAAATAATVPPLQLVDDSVVKTFLTLCHDLGRCMRAPNSKNISPLEMHRVLQDSLRAGMDEVQLADSLLYQFGERYFVAQQYRHQARLELCDFTNRLTLRDQIGRLLAATGFGLAGIVYLPHLRVMCAVMDYAETARYACIVLYAETEDVSPSTRTTPTTTTNNNNYRVLLPFDYYATRADHDAGTLANEPVSPLEYPTRLCSHIYIDRERFVYHEVLYDTRRH